MVGEAMAVVEELEVLASSLPNSGAAVTVCGVVCLSGWAKTGPELETWLNSPPGLGSVVVEGGGPNSGFTWVVGRPCPNMELAGVEAGGCWPN